MWYLILFFMSAGVLGAVIGYVVETSWSVTTETLIGISMVIAVWVVTKATLQCFTAIDKAVRDAEESAGR